MFGYVTPLVDELKVKEHIFYKSVYCGLCRYDLIEVWQMKLLN